MDLHLTNLLIGVSSGKAPLKLVPDEPQLTYSERAEAQFIPTASQSLLESARAALPEEDGPEHLMFLAIRQPGLYATFLGKLIAGSSFKASAMAIGVNVNKIYHWLQQGSADLADDVDSYCSRLLLDCQRAQAMGVSDAEERVHKNNPDKWLGRGPAQDFHKGRFWKEQQRLPVDDMALAQGQEDIDPLDPPPLREIEHIEEGEEDTGEKELTEALKVLEDHQIITNPEFIKQAKEQFRLDKPKEDKK